MSSAGYCYQLYDLCLESDEPLSLARWRAGAAEETWRFERGAVESFPGVCVHDVLDFDGRRRLKVWVDGDEEITFSHGDTRVSWRSREQVIRFEAGADLDIRTAIVLERMVAPIALFLSRPGFVALHASAVGDAEGNAWVFVGNSGAGKSTTALELMRRGFELLADDLVMIDVEKRSLIAVTPSLRLFDKPEEIPEAVERELVMPGIEKYWYQLPERPSPRRTHHLRGIFSLEPDDEVTHARIAVLRGQPATTRLLAQCFDLSGGANIWRAQRFRRICDLARSVAVHSVSFGHHNRSCPAQCEAIAARISGEVAS